MNKKKTISIIVLIIGLLVLVVGIVFMIIKYTAGPAVADGDYLVEVGSWKLNDQSNCQATKKLGEDGNDESSNNDSSNAGAEDSASNTANSSTDINTNELVDTACIPSVVWQFTEIGKGKLTTNAHQNDYNFEWALKDGKLRIRTDWLYPLDDEYEYAIDQGAGKLILKNGEKEYTFVKL